MSFFSTNDSHTQRLCDRELNSRGRPGFPGLLHWQVLFPAFVLGLLAVKWLVPAASLLLIYAILASDFSRRFRGLWFLPLLFACGFFYAQWHLPEVQKEIPRWMEQRKKVDLSAVIKSVRGYPGGRLRMELENVVCSSPEGKEVPLAGITLWTWFKPEKRPLPGQSLKLYTRIKPIVGFRNPGVWDYTFYSRTKNRTYRIFSRGSLKDGKLGPPPTDFLNRVRRSYRQRIESLAPAGQGGAFFPALLEGDRFFLSRGTVELLRKAGLSHTLALSGLHVGFVAALGIFLAVAAGYVFPSLYLHIPRQKLAVLFSAPLILFYLWMGGFTPSLLRASCMFGFWGILLLMNRSRVLLDGLFMAVALLLLFSPLSVFDIGLQFSALAVLGISLFFRPLYDPLRKMNFPGAAAVRFLGAVLVVSICANLALLPLLIWNFGVVTPNLLFNVVWIPVLGSFVIPVCAFGGLALSFISHDGGEFMFRTGAHVIEFFLGLFREADTAGWLPEYSVYRPLWAGIAAYFILLATVFLYYCRRRVSLIAVVIVIVLCSLSVFRAFEYRGKLRIVVLDTGQSQSVLVEGPKGSRTLVDGGGTFGSFDMGRSIVGPYLTHGRLPVLDKVILSHKDNDHSEGLVFILENFKVGEFCYNGRLPSGKMGERYLKTLSLNNIPVRLLLTGDIVSPEPGVKIEILHPDKGYEGTSNNRSLALRVVLNGRGVAFLSGDLEKEGVESVLNRDAHLDSDLMILPHHGSGGSLSPELYSRINPSEAAAACGYLNWFGFVAPSVRGELENRNIKLHTTAAEGALEYCWNARDGSVNCTMTGPLFYYHN